MKGSELVLFQLSPSVLFLEVSELLLECPLHARFLVILEKLLACRRGLAVLSIACAGRDQLEIALPQTTSRNKAMFQALPCHVFQLWIRKSEGHNCTQILMRHIGARYALVPGCERNGHSIFEIGGQWVVGAFNPENAGIAGKADLDQYLA